MRAVDGSAEGAQIGARELLGAFDPKVNARDRLPPGAPQSPTTVSDPRIPHDCGNTPVVLATPPYPMSRGHANGHATAGHGSGEDSGAGPGQVWAAAHRQLFHRE